MLADFAAAFTLGVFLADGLPLGVDFGLASAFAVAGFDGPGPSSSDSRSTAAKTIAAATKF